MHLFANKKFADVIPTHTYINHVGSLENYEIINGNARVLQLHGRFGINPISIHTTIKLGNHTLNKKKGTVTLWFFSLEDLAASFVANHMAIDNPNYMNYPFLSDYPVQREYDKSNFFFGWFRQNELRAQFFNGTIHPLTGFEPPQKAWVQAVPFNYFDKNQWYQLAVTWDVEQKDARLYVNGILVGTSDRFNKDFHRDICGEVVYAGSPAICHGEINFYDQVLTQTAVYSKYRKEATDYKPTTEKLLKKTFSGTNQKNFKFKPGKNWVKALDLDFQKPEHINQFYIQGEVSSVKKGINHGGLLIETPKVTFENKNRNKQVYIWSKQYFEGDIYIEFEWKALAENGLSLLMVNATGMARERFMEDYPLRTSGQMHMVHAENIRNYHWEFFREMHDVRNDVGTAFSRKNPFQFRNGFGSLDKPFAKNEWHKLQYLQIDGKIRGAIDGKIILSIDDSSRMNTGCILNAGNIAIRCMLNTAIVFRNLKVYNRELPFQEIEILSK